MSDTSVLYTFKWPEGPSEVIVTGSFDGWTGSHKLERLTDGSFKREVSLDLGKPTVKGGQEHYNTIYFKFIVDGKWTTSEDYDKEHDKGCNENNVIFGDELAQLAHGQGVNRTLSAGNSTLPVDTPGGFPTTSESVTTGQESQSKVSQTVKDQNVAKKQLETEDNMTQEAIAMTVGGPGPVMVENPAQVEAFTQLETKKEEKPERAVAELSTNVHEPANPHETELVDRPTGTTTPPAIQQGSSDDEESNNGRIRGTLYETTIERTLYVPENGTSANAEATLKTLDPVVIENPVAPETREQQTNTEPLAETEVQPAVQSVPEPIAVPTVEPLTQSEAEKPKEKIPIKAKPKAKPVRKQAPVEEKPKKKGILSKIKKIFN